VQKYPMIAALKAIVAHYGADAEWSTVRPPLVPLDEAQRAALLAGLEARGFAMPGLGAAAQRFRNRCFPDGQNI